METQLKTRKKEVAKLLLQGIGLAILITGALVFPGIGPMVAFVEKTVRDHRRESRYAFQRMQREGLLKVSMYKRGVKILLLPKGERRLSRYKLQGLKIQKPAKWDRKWRFIMFDVPEARRDVRDLVRRKLLDLGFVNLQKSVYVQPYACDEVEEVLRDHYRLQAGELYIFEASIRKGEEHLRQYFKV